MRKALSKLIGRAALTSLLAGSAPAFAAHDENDIPYWGSIRSDTANMRVGPGDSYRISWVYHRAHLPVKVLRAMEGWRLVEDPDGARGWVLGKFISKQRHGYVVGRDPSPMHEAPDWSSRLLWKLAPGITPKLGECANGWCKVEINDRPGFVRQASLWGTAALK